MSTSRKLSIKSLVVIAFSLFDLLGISEMCVRHCRKKCFHPELVVDISRNSRARGGR